MNARESRNGDDDGRKKMLYVYGLWVVWRDRQRQNVKNKDPSTWPSNQYMYVKV